MRNLSGLNITTWPVARRAAWMTALTLAASLGVAGCGDDGGDDGTPMPEEDGGMPAPDAGPEEIILTRATGCPLRGGSGNSVEANFGTDSSVTYAMTRLAPSGAVDGFLLTELKYRLFDTEIEDPGIGVTVTCEGGGAHDLLLFQAPRDAAPPATPEDVRRVSVPESPADNDPPEDCEPTEVCRGMAERTVPIDPPFQVDAGNALHVAVVVAAAPAERVCPALCFRTPSQSWSSTQRPEVETYNWTAYQIVNPMGEVAFADVHLDARGLLIEGE